MRFKSKVVEIEAMQFNGSPQNEIDIIEWAGPQANIEVSQHADHSVLMVKTLEGVMQANPGDWIIRGTEGELCPCKPSVFERKYEAV